jgi:hypothetical protein
VVKPVPFALWSFALGLVGCGRIGFEPNAGVTDGATSDSWFDSAWSYRKLLTIDHTKVAGDVSGFPVLIQLDDPDLAKVGSTGADLRFVDATGMLLPHELEARGDVVAVGGAQGATPLTAWVRVPALSATADTTILMYYGNPNATDTQQPAAVWSGYAGVYHFGQNDPLDVHDSAGNNPGTNSGVMSVPARILGGGSFSGGANVNVSAGSVDVDVSDGGYNTVSFWLFYNGPYGNAAFAFSDGGTTGYDLWMETPACFGFNTQNSDVLGVPGSPLVNRWVHVAAVFYNGVPDAAHNQLWIDGTLQPITQCVGAPLSRRAGIMIWGSGGSYELTGMLDEARVAPGVRTAPWLATEYRNQADPMAFVTAGAEQTVP